VLHISLGTSGLGCGLRWLGGPVVVWEGSWLGGLLGPVGLVRISGVIIESRVMSPLVNLQKFFG